MNIFELVPLQNHCRYFIRYQATTKFNRGFKSKKEINKWLKNLFEKYSLEWRVGYLIKLRCLDSEFEILDKRGKIQL